MELKDYQQKAIDQIKQYLKLLDEWRAKSLKNPELEIDFPLKAWEKAEIKRSYRSRKNGLGEQLPNFCLKIPTGGGKTFLAVKAIDLINTAYRKKKTGLILWVVPTSQIYSQTIKSLRDRGHPYRQHLDIASGGRTMIVEKMDRFSPLDIQEHLVVLMLMLPSAARQSKETLKVFKDNGGFQDFFPPEDEIESQKKMLERFPNLDTYGTEAGFWGRQIKTSLGNTLRTLAPVIILDEGHKAYSETAQDTLRGFNPSIIVELSATPSPISNVLVDIKGMELNREEMIKLDLHIINKASPDWKATLLASVEKNNILQRAARKYEANTGIYIRPIGLIQVERTGKDQRGGRFIHSEDVREYLTKIVGIPENQVAVTSAELKEIEGVDLYNPGCPIRYIITKQALQEGWDCSFAYILTVLTNPNSKNALTQLVGRILRQPFARKTGINELDESYVFAFQQKAANILSSIKDGFEDEGLGDLTGQIVSDEMLKEAGPAKERICEVRPKFKREAAQIFLPLFVVRRSGGWRPVSYEMDIVSCLDWSGVDISPMFALPLSGEEAGNIEVAVNLSEDESELIAQRQIRAENGGGIEIDPVFLTRHLLDIIPNPWTVYDFCGSVISKLVARHGREKVANNFVYIIEEARKYLINEKDRLAKKAFESLITSDIARFMFIGEDWEFRLPKKISAASNSRTLTRSNGQPLQISLFDFVPEEDFNETEKSVAWYLEEQSRLFFWYRNRSRKDYSIQGWKKNKIYPDFIFTEKPGNQERGFNRVFVVETKGIHLKNEDTAYKQSVFNLCNMKAKEKNLTELGLKLKNRDVHFEVVFEDEWKRKLNEMLA